LSPLELAKGQPVISSLLQGSIAAGVKRGGEQPPSLPDSQKKGGEMISSATGFFISSDGYLLTNHHVVNDCPKIVVRNRELESEVRLIDSDKNNDLALLKTKEAKAPSFAPFRSGKGIRIGDAITVPGYPLSSYLGSSIRATTGTVSAQTGLRNNSGEFQFAAEIQPGNSGGPVLDTSGNIVGIVSYRFSDIELITTAGLVPQNMNFAIKSDAIKMFMDANDVGYSSAASSESLSAADVIDQAKIYTVQVLCFR